MNWRLVAAWVVALALTTALTWQIVNVADSRVSAQPVEIAAPVTSSSFGGSTSTTPGVAAVASTTATSTPVATSPTATTATTGSTVVTVTTAAADWSLRNIKTSGGSVIVRFRPDEVELQAATPAPGFEVDIDDAGPPKVRVEFDDGDDDKVRVEAEWKDGALEVRVDEDS